MTAAIVAQASLAIPEHLPGRIQGQDRGGITAGIGMVLLHQGAIGGLDLGAAGPGMHAEHGIGISGSGGHDQKETQRCPHHPLGARPRHNSAGHKKAPRLGG